MAAQLPDVDLVRVARWCDEKVPQFARNQVRMEYRVRVRPLQPPRRRW